MKAEEARALQDEFYRKSAMDLDKIYNKISRAASSGLNSVQIDLNSINAVARPRVLKEATVKLEAAGYCCEHVDQNDTRNSRNYLKLSW